MYSIQRRNERFKIIYIYKIKEKLVPNISNKYGLTFKVHGRYGYKCDMPTFPIRGRAMKARGSSFAWTVCDLWNSLPKCVWDITGKDVYFKNKLDKVLAFYTDIPRCSRSGHSYDRNFSKSNSLCDQYRNVEIKHKIDNIAKV